MLKNFQKSLRKNSTDAETVLWMHLRNRRFSNFKFRRQVIIKNFIVDFICLERKLIIELDGGQHLEQKTYDENRSSILKQEGFHILRFWNHDIFKNITVVLETIHSTLKE